MTENPPIHPAPEAPRHSPWPMLGAVAVLLGASWAAYAFLDAWMPQWFDTHTYDVTKDHPWLRALQPLGKASVPIWLFLLWTWSTRRLGHAARFRLLATGLLAIALVGPPTFFVKQATNRQRPSDYMRGRDPSEGTKSFPSGDSALAFAAATTAVGFAGVAWAAPAYAAAAAVAVMRATVTRHYPSDIFAGAALGIAAGWLALVLGKRWFNRPPPKFLRRSRGVFAVILVGVPVEYLIDDELLGFFAGFGALLAVMLVLTNGRRWLAWLAASPDRGRDTARRRARIGGLVVVLIFALATLSVLPWNALFDRDEGYYATVSREMWETKNFLVPHYSGEPWLEKPPLAYWLMAPSIGVFGETEFAARLASALFGLLSVWLTFRLALRLGSGRAAALSAAALGAAPMFAIVSSLAMLDTALLACLLLSMLGLWRVIQGPDRWGAVMFYLGCGLGALAKGPLGFGLPIMALVGYLGWSGDWALLKRMWIAPGLALAVAVSAAWAIPANIATEGWLFRELVWVRTLQPVFQPLQGKGGESFAGYLATIPLYVPVIVGGFLPWSIFLWPAGRDLLKRGRRDKAAAFLGGWFVVQFAAFSLVRTKLPHHILPALPPLAIAMGLYWDRLIAGRVAPPQGRRASAISIALGAVGILVAVALIIVAPSQRFRGLEWLAFVPAALAAAASGVLPARHWRRRPARAAALMVGLTILALSLIWQVGLPAIDRAKAAPRIAESLREHYGYGFPEVRLGARGFREMSLAFYTGLPMHNVPFEELPEFLSRPGPVAVVFRDRDYERAREEGLLDGHSVVFEDRAWLPERGTMRRFIVTVGEGGE